MKGICDRTSRINSCFLSEIAARINRKPDPVPAMWCSGLRGEGFCSWLPNAALFWQSVLTARLCEMRPLPGTGELQRPRDTDTVRETKGEAVRWENRKGRSIPLLAFVFTRLLSPLYIILSSALPEQKQTDGTFLLVLL